MAMWARISRTRGTSGVKYESYWNPGTVRGQQHRAFGQYCAFRRLVRYPRLSRYLLHEVLPNVLTHVNAEAHARADTPVDHGWRDTTAADVRRVLAELPGVMPWPWLVTELVGFVVMLSLYLVPGEIGDILRDRRSLDEWISSDGPIRLIEDALRLEREDAHSQQHLARAVELLPLNEQFLRPGRGVDLTHAMIDRWARDAHAAVEAAASEPVPRPTRKRTGDIDRWAGWWYRHEVLEETLSVIVESEYGIERVKSLTGYVGQRVGLIRELLDDTTTGSSPP